MATKRVYSPSANRHAQISPGKVQTEYHPGGTDVTGNEPDMANDNQAAFELSHGTDKKPIPPRSSDEDAASGWTKRKSVLREIVLGSPASRNLKHKWDPSLWKLDYQGILSILRAEAFRAQTKSEQTETAPSKTQENTDEDKQSK